MGAQLKRQDVRQNTGGNVNEPVTETIDLPAPMQATQEAGPSGVGGWLLVLCIWLAVIVPLANLGVLGFSLQQTVPAYDRVQGLLTLDVLNGAMVLALVVFSVFTGVCLWQRRDEGVLKLLRILLLGFVLSKPVAAILPFLSGMEPSVSREIAQTVMMSAGGSVIMPMIVLIYTQKSKRVRNTYAPISTPSA